LQPGLDAPVLFQLQFQDIKMMFNQIGDKQATHSTEWSMTSSEPIILGGARYTIATIRAGRSQFTGTPTLTVSSFSLPFLCPSLDQVVSDRNGKLEMRQEAIKDATFAIALRAWMILS
jgi:hypothetical protein